MWELYLTPEGLDNLSRYHYAAVDNSLLVKWFFKRFWDWVVTKVPLSIAPNTLTVAGLVCNFCAFAAILAACPDEADMCVAPSYVYVFLALCCFLYQILDNIDGKQARRTASSSPVGEILDHACDAFSIGLYCIMSTTVMQVPTAMSVYFFLAGAISFFFFHVEEFLTGTLVLQTLGNPTEVQWGFISIMMFTAFQGPAVWRSHIFPNVPLYSLMAYASYFGVVASLLSCMWNVLRHVRRRHQSVSSAVFTGTRLLVPHLTVILLGLTWFLLSPMMVVSWPRLYLLMMCGVCAHIVTHLIVMRVAKCYPPLYYAISTPLVFGVANALSRYFTSDSMVLLDEHALLFAVCTTTLGYHAYYSTMITRQLCNYLGIRVFSIGAPGTPVPV